MCTYEGSPFAHVDANIGNSGRVGDNKRGMDDKTYYNKYWNEK